MKNRKVLKAVSAVVMSMALMFTAVGCGTDSSATGSNASAVDASATESAADVQETATDDLSSIKVAILLSGTITDNGWNTLGYESMMALADKYGIMADYVESIAVSDLAGYARDYAELGYDIIISHGSQYVEATNSVAADYPNTKFVIAYGLDDASEYDNVYCVGPINEGVLCGIACGALTTSNHVAFVGGDNIPTISSLADTFEYGVKLVNDDCEVDIVYVGSTTDSDKAKEVTNECIQNGVDVVCGSANSATLGIHQAAAENGIYSIGFNADQYESAPEACVVSVVRDYEMMYEDFLLNYVNDTLDQTLYQYTIRDGGTTYSDWHGWDEKLDEEDISKIEDTLAGILDGTIEEP